MADYIYCNGELYHYGVKGMKWGVRRSKEQLDHDRYSIQARVNRNISKIKAPNGIKLTKMSDHALGRSQDPTRLFTAKDVLNALSSPLHIGPVVYDKYGQPSRKIYGEYATVVVNPDTGVIPTAWKTGSRTRKKLLEKRG